MNEPVRLAAEHLRLAYDERVVVDDLDLALTDGSFTAIVGPNGCGKSTLLRALGRLMRPSAGQVLLDGRAIARTPTREVARVLGLLPQTPVAPDGLTVADLVARGRHPHQSWLRQWSRDDEAVVAEALAWTDLTELADRPVDALSGGQRQRAWISMALAQGTDLLLLDEPTTYLDLAHQIDVLDLITDLNRQERRTGTTIGVPETGSGRIRASRSKTSASSCSVSTSAGVPEATSSPSFMATSRWAYRAARFRSCSTTTTVRPRSACRRATSSRTSIWCERSR